MAFSLEDTQNAVPGLSNMAEQQKLSVAPRKADTQSVTKRFDHASCPAGSSIDPRADYNQN